MQLFKKKQKYIFCYIITDANCVETAVSKSNTYTAINKGCHFTLKPEIWQFRQKNLEILGIWEIKKKITETFNKKLEKPEIFNNFNMFSSKVSIWHIKSII